MIESTRRPFASATIAEIWFSLRTKMDNPYETKASSEIEHRPSPFGAPYWLTLLASGVGFFLLLPVVPAIGMIGIGGFTFAFVRTLMYAKLISKGELRNATEKLSGPWFPFLLTSYACGLLATVAACIGFLAVCIPTGVAIFSVGSNSSVGFVFVFAAVIAAFIVAVGAGGTVLRWSLPTKDAIIPAENTTMWIEDPREPDVPSQIRSEADE